MNRRQFLGSASLAATPLPAAQASASAEHRTKAGFAERDITPSIGMEQPGGYGKSYHRSFHDPCKVRASVFADGTARVALVGLDALVVPRSVVTAARAQIRQKCGIEERFVLIGASHSHSSGPVGMVMPGEYDHASPFVQKLAYEHSSMADAGYLLRVQTEIVNAVCAADAARVEADCGFGSGTESQVAYNRRFRMKNGLTYTHPGQGNPDIVETAGPIDPEVGVIGAWNKNGKLLGCVVNYACHATTSPGGISANWIYYLEKMIRGAFGQDTVVVFVQGFCGDITQVNNLSPYAPPTGDQYARLVGGRVAAEAVKVLLAATPGAAAPVQAGVTVLRIPRRPPSPERVRRSLEIAKQDPKEAGLTEWLFAKEIVMLDALMAKEKNVECEVQALQVGPTVFVAAPGEMFCQFGLDIKKGSRFRFTYPVELANGIVGYIPTEEALGKNGGGYETRLTSYSNLAPSAGRQMVQAGLALVRALTPGPVPEPPKPRTFREPWSYGNVPPELS
jgi:hypothetical protein